MLRNWINQPKPKWTVCCHPNTAHLLTRGGSRYMPQRERPEQVHEQVSLESWSRTQKCKAGSVSSVCHQLAMCALCTDSTIPCYEMGRRFEPIMLLRSCTRPIPLVYSSPTGIRRRRYREAAEERSTEHGARGRSVMGSPRRKNEPAATCHCLV